MRAGSLTANMPTAVTILLFSALVNTDTALEAKLGSATVRPLPVICLGGIVAGVRVVLGGRVARLCGLS
jgi:hypothetical protein